MQSPSAASPLEQRTRGAAADSEAAAEVEAVADFVAAEEVVGSPGAAVAAAAVRRQ